MEKEDKNNFFEKSGIYCLKVSGSPYEIGFQQGKILKNYLKRAIYPFLFDDLEKIASKTQNNLNFYPFKKLFLRNLRNKGSKYIENIPQENKEELRGFCEASGVDYQKALQAYVLPEIMSYLLSRMKENNYALNTHLSGAFLLGCSSMVVANQATENGELLHGRNFDFITISHQENFPLVSYIHPEEGFSYISISSPGIYGGVVTGINEHGLTYSLQQNYTSEHQENNLPILALGTLILKSADSLEQAAKIIREKRATGGWSVVVTDYRKKEAFVAEICADEVYFRQMKDNYLLCTNSYLAEELHEKEIVINPILNISSNTRYSRLKDLVKTNYQKLNPQIISNFLGDRFDPNSNREKIFGYTISQNFTSCSVVFAPDRGCFWVASGKTPVCQGKYLPFSSNFENSKSLSSPIFPGRKFEQGAKSEALKLIIEAQDLYENKQVLKALENLKMAIGFCDYDEPVIFLLCGLIYLKIGEINLALEYLQKAYDYTSDIYRSGVIKLWMGRTLDLLKNREKAIKQYQYVANMNREIYYDLVNLGYSGLKKAYSRSQLKYINPDIGYGEELYIR